MKKIITLILVTGLCMQSFGNAAMPGMWNAGHGSQFYPLVAADSIYFGKIKMQKERVLINLYSGFAVVKGEYWMYNTTNKAITMTVGYPVNGQYRQEVVNNVTFDDLYNLKVLVNDKQVSTLSSRDTSAPNNLSVHNGPFRGKDWYLWKTTFAANTITKLTVYFITDNSHAHIRRGYSTAEGSGFAYILETGRAWGGSIDSGQVLINMNDNLTIKNIKGLLPDSTLTGDDTHLQYTFTNLDPYPANNILLWYDHTEKEGFDISNVAAKSGEYFKEIDAFPVQAFSQASFKTIYKSDFKVKDTASWIFIAIIAGVGLLALAVITAVVYLVYKLVKGPERKKYDF